MNTTDRKNIFFLQRSIALSDGGVPRVSDVISKELTKRGYKCYFLYYLKENDDYPPHSKLKVDMKLPYKKFERSILDFIAKNNINVFICQNADDFKFIRFYKRLRILYPTYPFVRFLHASPDYWQMSYKMKTDSFKLTPFFPVVKNLVKSVVYSIYHPYITKTRELFKMCDKFILLSDSFEESFVKTYSITELGDKLATIPNPLTFTTNLSSEELRNKEKIVLIVSRLNEHQKRIATALKIWQLVSQKNNHGWKLVIVGSGPDEKMYKDLVAKNKIQNVTFTGHKSDVVQYCKESSLFMMTSSWEGFPMSIMEAQQSGVVAIGFDNFAALYDMIADGENGYIIHNNNQEQFAEKMYTLMMNDELRYKMACQSVESSKQFFVSRVVDKWEAVLNGI